MSNQANVLHQPVLLAEAVDALITKPDGIYVDGTYGRGGHSRAILQRLSGAGRLYAFDKDLDAIEFASLLDENDERFCLNHASFSDAPRILSEAGIAGVDGVLLDLGVSSPQLDVAARGFGFMEEGPLDMRMNTTQPLTAAIWLQQAEEAEIAKVIWEYGEERFSRHIARAIVKHRETSKLETTHELAELVARNVYRKEKHKHPATRTFQAIRIYINQELGELQSFLAQLLSVLNIGGRVVVISFHSLEDRIVKQFIKSEYKGEPDLLPDLPIPNKIFDPRLKPVGKLIRPSDNEVNLNPRARSAVMRVAERLR